MRMNNYEFLEFLGYFIYIIRLLFLNKKQTLLRIFLTMYEQILIITLNNDSFTEIQTHATIFNKWHVDQALELIF